MAGKRKVKRFVIDVNTFITIFINRETDWLLKYILQNRIEIFTDKYLIEELVRVLDYPRVKKYLPHRHGLKQKRQPYSIVFNYTCPEQESNLHIVANTRF